jgi:hypothetical protein
MSISSRTGAGHRLVQLKEVWCFKAGGNGRHNRGHARGRCEAGQCLQTISGGGFRFFFFLLLFLIRFFPFFI